MNVMLRRPALDPEALSLPLLGRLLPAGFPSPADDYLEGEIDLNRLLIERPAACYLMRVSGPLDVGRGHHGRRPGGGGPQRRAGARATWWWR